MNKNSILISKLLTDLKVIHKVLSTGAFGEGGAMAKATANTLYFGDNLDILREYVEDESVDLIYLDPPFNSQAQYNVLFDRTKDVKVSAQAGAFRDTWIWGEEAAWAYAEVMKAGGASARFIDALRAALGDNNMMAYIAMMAVRLQDLHRKLKDTGSLYLHCDPTASHYLKVLLDQIFGPGRCLNEVIWKRTGAHSAAHRWGDVHDSILFYSKSDRYTWNKVFTEYDEAYKARYKNEDADGRLWTDDNLTAPGIRRGDSGAAWKGFDPTEKGNHWKISNAAVIEIVGEDEAAKLTTTEKLAVLDDNGLLHWPKSGGFPRFKRVLGRGMPLQDVIADIAPLNSQAQERIGYPTQKPIALLERIIAASSNEGDVILDPFCGCGTTVEAAERLKRRWVGIDVAVHAIKVIESRFDELAEKTGHRANYKIEGMPRDFASALGLAERDKYQFQWWANYLFNPHALREQKKGADRGIDGELFFPNGPGRPWGRMLTSVKGGAVTPAMVRDFGYVLQREKAEMGLFICLRHPTRAMSTEAAGAGIADTVHGDLPRLQIVAIEDWFESKLPLLPPLEHLPSAAISRTSRRRAVKRSHPDSKTGELLLPQIGGKADKDVVRHFNPAMVARAAPSTGLFDTPKQKGTRAL